MSRARTHPTQFSRFWQEWCPHRRSARRAHLPVSARDRVARNSLRTLCAHSINQACQSVLRSMAPDDLVRHCASGGGLGTLTPTLADRANPLQRLLRRDCRRHRTRNREITVRWPFRLIHVSTTRQRAADSPRCKPQRPTAHRTRRRTDAADAGSQARTATPGQLCLAIGHRTWRHRRR